jgi:hypothetical protein
MEECDPALPASADGSCQTICCTHPLTHSPPPHARPLTSTHLARHRLRADVRQHGRTLHGIQGVCACVVRERKRRAREDEEEREGADPPPHLAHTHTCTCTQTTHTRAHSRTRTLQCPPGYSNNVDTVDFSCSSDLVRTRARTPPRTHTRTHTQTHTSAHTRAPTQNPPQHGFCTFHTCCDCDLDEVKSCGNRVSANPATLTSALSLPLSLPLSETAWGYSEHVTNEVNNDGDNPWVRNKHTQINPNDPNNPNNPNKPIIAL